MSIIGGDGMKRSILREVLIVAGMTTWMAAACQGDACDRQFYVDGACTGIDFSEECCMGGTEQECDEEIEGAHWTCCNNPDCRQDDDS